MIALLPLLLACGTSSTPLEEVLAADASRTGAGGSDGPFGAAFTQRTWPARVTDRVTADVMLPVDGESQPVVKAAPTVVFVPGGLVEPARYQWVAAHLASRGYAVITPHEPLDLAIFAIGNAQAALDGTQADEDLAPFVSERAIVTGHSLGGVVAVKNWLVDDRFLGVMLLASFAAGGDDPTDRTGSPVLSIGGVNDQSALPEDVAAGFERFGDPRWLAMVDDLNHYAWTDGATESELAGDGPVQDLPAARTRALTVVDIWLDAVMSDGDFSALDLPIDGVTVTR